MFTTIAITTSVFSTLNQKKNFGVILYVSCVHPQPGNLKQDKELSNPR